MLFVQTLPEQNALTQKFSLKILNSIVWGDLDSELQTGRFSPGEQFDLRNTLIKTTDTTQSFVEVNLYNQEPQFVDPVLYNYRLDSLSPAIDAGMTIGVDQDLDGNPRDAQPDVGAYEYIKP